MLRPMSLLGVLAPNHDYVRDSECEQVRSQGDGGRTAAGRRVRPSPSADPRQWGRRRRSRRRRPYPTTRAIHRSDITVRLTD